MKSCNMNVKLSGNAGKGINILHLPLNEFHLNKLILSIQTSYLYFKMYLSYSLCYLFQNKICKGYLIPALANSRIRLFAI